MTGRPWQRWRPLARWRWEQAHGAIPAGQIVAHKNGDSTDDQVENLYLTTRVELIRRQGARDTVIKKRAAANRRRHELARRIAAQPRVIWRGCR
jgi:hypothetical protein